MCVKKRHKERIWKCVIWVRQKIRGATFQYVWNDLFIFVTRTPHRCKSIIHVCDRTRWIYVACLFFEQNVPPWWMRYDLSIWHIHATWWHMDATWHRPSLHMQYDISMQQCDMTCPCNMMTYLCNMTYGCNIIDGCDMIYPCNMTGYGCNLTYGCNMTYGCNLTHGCNMTVMQCDA